MSLSILNTKSTKGKYTFEIKSDIENPLEKSFVNAIRRTILTEIPTVGISQSDVYIEKNETSLHNEFMKHRISMIPLNIDPISYKDDYLFTLNVENKTDKIRVVTTNDFKIYPLKKENIGKSNLSFDKENYDENQISDKLKKTILKPYEIEGITSYIIITELKPKTSDEEYQHINFWFSPRIGTGKENASFNNIPQCSYSYHENSSLLNKAISDEIKLKAISRKMEQQKLQKEFTNAYRQRYFHRTSDNEPYWYNFVVKSNHYYKSKKIFEYSIEILIDILNRCSENFKLVNIDPEKSRYSAKILENKSIEFILNQENDTVGNILQSHISNNITDSTLISFCGYKKIHPLEEKIKLILCHKQIDDIDDTSVISKIIFSIIENIDEIINILESLLEQSKKV